jgi:hypothetical protein
MKFFDFIADLLYYDHTAPIPMSAMMHPIAPFASGNFRVSLDLAASHDGRWSYAFAAVSALHLLWH